MRQIRIAAHRSRAIATEVNREKRTILSLKGVHKRGDKIKFTLTVKETISMSWRRLKTPNSQRLRKVYGSGNED